MNSVMAHDRRRVVYRGHVQGVGFRATTRSLALGYDVAGFVRNLPDGSVEVLAWGEASELDRFLSAVQTEFASKIDDVEISPFVWESTEPSGFSIRY